MKLDDIRAEAERRYGDLEVEFPGGIVRFRAFLRLPEHARTAFVSYEQEFRGLIDADSMTDTADAGRVLDIMRDMLAVTADDPDLFLSSIRQLDDGPAVVATLWEHYQNKSQPGEAPRSVS